LFKPNLKEMREGLSMAIHKESDASLAQAVQRMHERLEASISMVTLSERGVCFYAPDHSQDFQRIPAFEREITDISGAGDAVIAVASVLLGLDVPVWQIAAVANLAGGLVCEKVGVVTVERERLQAEWETHADAMAALMNSK
jgi:bifunctional ADP-heptose synthase (sugar kinase/adenylyltransferase)